MTFRTIVSKRIIFTFADNTATTITTVGTIEIEGDTLVNVGPCWRATYSGWVKVRFM